MPTDSGDDVRVDTYAKELVRGAGWEAEGVYLPSADKVFLREFQRDVVAGDIVHYSVLAPVGTRARGPPADWMRQREVGLVGLRQR